MEYHPCLWNGRNGVISEAPDVKDFKDLLDPSMQEESPTAEETPLIGWLSPRLDPLHSTPILLAYQKFLDEMEKVLIAGKPRERPMGQWGSSFCIHCGRKNMAARLEQAGWKLHSENPNIDYLAPTSGALAWGDTFAIGQEREPRCSLCLQSTSC